MFLTAQWRLRHTGSSDFHPRSHFTKLLSRPLFFGPCQLSLFTYLPSMSGLSRSCCRWHEWNNIVRSRRSLDFVRSRVTRAHPSESELPYAIKYFLKHISYRTERWMDLYGILDFKSNPRNSSHFEINFKRTINCPTARANTNELTGVIIALLCSLLNNGGVIMRTSHLSLRN